MSIVPVASDDAELMKMNKDLREMILENKYITKETVAGLVTSGCLHAETYYCLGTPDSAATSQRNLGVSPPSLGPIDGISLVHSSVFSIMVN